MGSPIGGVVKPTPGLGKFTSWNITTCFTVNPPIVHVDVMRLVTNSAPPGGMTAEFERLLTSVTASKGTANHISGTKRSLSITTP